MEQWRLQFLKGCIVFLLLGVAVRLFYWQVLRSDQLQAQAESQRTAQVKMPGQRGSILFADGTPLVTSKLSYLLFADKALVKDIPTVSRSLAPLVNQEEASLSAKLNQDLGWIPLAPSISSETKKLIEDLNILGLGFDRHQIRMYPEASMAAKIVGFVGKDDAGNDKGYFGLEGFYNNALQGKAGLLVEEKDITGKPILTAQTLETQPRQGDTLQLNIDRTIQFIAEQRLKEGLEKYGAAAGDITIIDPKTGAVLAMAVAPGYNPAEYFVGDTKTFKNPIVADTYEPGSTFKSLIMSAAINEGVVTPESTCPCTDYAKISGYTIKNWDNTMHPGTTMNDILKNSDNNGMIYVGSRLGHDKLLSYIKQFGFGQSTNIDMQEEEVPALRDENTWYDVDYATATFGQGIAVTPIQLIKAVAAIANNGVMMEPHVVKKIITDTKEVTIEPKPVATVLKPETAKTVTDMLVYTVDNGEAGKLYKPKGFEIAAKSGTAQISLSGRYAEGKTISSYIGFAPAHNPRFVMLVRLIEPRGGEHGATTAGPIFYTIAKELFAYWGIVPQGN